MADVEIQDFKVDIPKEEVDRLHRKLQDTRLPAREIVPHSGDRYGETCSILTRGFLHGTSNTGLIKALAMNGLRRCWRDGHMILIGSTYKNS